MLKLGRAQGVAIAAVLTKYLPIQEYASRKIKQAITDNGNASMEQVAKMLQSLLKLKRVTKKTRCYRWTRSSCMPLLSRRETSLR
jgi:crossover junction endodeoxyribonuclease RuvC